MEVWQWGTNELAQMDKEYRRKLINCISGFKSANLIGTVNAEGQANLAIFNSVVHIGANPPLLGIVVRPITVPRHTYNNIKETGYFTINSVHKSFFKQAHQTSANYPSSLSEFEECGLTPTYGTNHPAPYVHESEIRIGLELNEELPIKSNGTILLIGHIIELHIPQHIVATDGYINLHQAGVISVNGLDAYHETVPLQRLAYARPGVPTKAVK